MKKEKRKIVLSQSSIKTLFDCEKAYYFAHVRNLEKKKFVDYFLEGEIFQFGIFRLMAKDPLKKATSGMLKLLASRVQELRKEGLIDSRAEQRVVEIKVILTGMLQAYAARYEKDLKIERHVGNEISCIYPLTDEVDLGIQMDNIVEAKGKWYLHEGKAWKTLNENVVQNLEKSFQIATYFHSHNNYRKAEMEVVQGKKKIKIKTKDFSGVLFDAVMKPSIRQKDGETYKEFLNRLSKYYSGPEANNKFFKDVIQTSIPFEKWENTVIEAAERAVRIHKGNAVETFSNCAWCDFYDLCFNGETKANLSMYRISDYSKRYKK